MACEVENIDATYVYRFGESLVLLRLLMLRHHGLDLITYI